MKRLLSCLNFVGKGVLGAIDAFWAGVDTLVHSHPARVKPPRRQFEGIRKSSVSTALVCAALAMLGCSGHAAVISQYTFTGAGSLTSSDTEANSSSGAITSGPNL